MPCYQMAEKEAQMKTSPSRTIVCVLACLLALLALAFTVQPVMQPPQAGDPDIPTNCATRLQMEAELCRCSNFSLPLSYK